MASEVALIFGVSGQDGAYLARLLLERGYVVHGTSRDREMANFSNLSRLGYDTECICTRRSRATSEVYFRSLGGFNQLAFII
jgi:GDP-D-mannose dehydratase